MLTWLKREPSTRGYVFLALGIVAYDLVQALVVVAYLKDTDTPAPADMEAWIKNLLEDPALTLRWLFTQVAGEEILYRVLPIAFAVWLWKSPGAVALVIIAASISFGWTHDGGVAGIGIGLMGIVLSLLYLKCGGWRAITPRALCVLCGAHYLADVFLFYQYVFVFDLMK